MVLEVVQFECSYLYCVIHQDILFYYIRTLLLQIGKLRRRTTCRNMNGKDDNAQYGSPGSSFS